MQRNFGPERRVRSAAPGGAAAAGLLALCLAPGEARAGAHPPVTSEHGVVAADDPTASKVGAHILAEGGNAMDAAAATALALGVVSPLSSGIGGGGFAVVYDAEADETRALDFRESAPAELTPEEFEVDGEPDASLARTGGLAVGVPGEIAGLDFLVGEMGELPFGEVVAPACYLAHAGFSLGWFVARQAHIVAEQLSDPDAEAGWLFADGESADRGEEVRRPRLARTLGHLGRHGARAFYEGPIAEDIANTVQEDGGVMTVEDLEDYEVIEREPIVGSYGDYELASMPLPSSGGIVMLQALGILEAYAEASGFDLSETRPGASAPMHIVAEALAHAFADRARFLGDEDEARAAVDQLLDAGRIEELAGRVESDRTLPPERYGSEELGTAAASGEGDGGTSHFCVVDGDGNAVALTTTINHYYGAKLVADRTGIVLNNEIDDFAVEPGAENLFGLVQAETNLVGPNKRPLSSMSPTLVFEDGELAGCFGGSGGPRIISNTLQAFLNVFQRDMDVSEAVSSPRIHHQWRPDELVVEDPPAEVARALEERGHELDRSPYITAVQAVVVGEDGALEAASDPRKGGRPAAAQPGE